VSYEGTLPSRAAGLPVRTLRVEVLEGPDAGAWRVAAAETLTIGTAEGNDLVLTDPTVSRFHLELAARGDGIQVVDHGSTNGTLAVGVRVERPVGVADRWRLYRVA